MACINLTEHAYVEAGEDGLDIYDVEHAILSGRIRKRWKREQKYEIVGPAFDKRAIGVVCRVTISGKVRVITVYSDNCL